MGNLRATLSTRDPFNMNIARGSYNPEVNDLAFERNWHSPRLELNLLQLREEEHQGAGYACAV